MKRWFNPGPERAAALAVLCVCALAMPSALALASDAAARPETLSVRECADIARRLAPDSRAAAGDLDAARLDSVALSHNRRPDLSLNAGAWVAPDGSYDPAFTNLGEYHAQLGAEWTLADGGRRERARARAGLDAGRSRARNVLVAHDAGESAATLAFHLLRLREVVAVLEDASGRLDRIGELVDAGVRSGLRSPADSIRLGLAREDAALDLDAARAEALGSRLDLLAAMGLPLDTGFVLRDAPKEDANAPGEADSEEVVSRFMRRPEIALVKLEENAARLDEQDAAHRSSAELGLTLDAGLAGTDLTHAVPPSLLATQASATFRDRLRRDMGASAALSLRLPLFNAARAPALEARRRAVESTALRTVAEQARQQRQAADLFLRWRSSVARVRATSSIVERADAHFLRTKSLYAAGATTLFDVLDAMQLLKDSRLRHAEAGEDLRMVRFQIEDRP